MVIADGKTKADDVDAPAVTSAHGKTTLNAAGTVPTHELLAHGFAEVAQEALFDVGPFVPDPDGDNGTGAASDMELHDDRRGPDHAGQNRPSVGAASPFATSTVLRAHHRRSIWAGTLATAFAVFLRATEHC